VRDGIRREMTEVAQAEGAKGIRLGQVVDLLPDVPVVAMTSQRRVVLRDGGVGRDVAVEEADRMRAQQLGHRRR